MKKNIVFALAVILISGLAAPSYCEGPVEKLGRGVSNILTSPCELPNQITKTYNQHGIAAAWTYGPLKGIWMAGYRALIGAYEAATFFFPWPGDYKPILTEPEFFFENHESVIN